jgi:hypothetical protein
MASNNLETWPFEAAVREVVALLAQRKYAALERLSGGVRLSATQLRTAVREYGRRIVVPPVEFTPPLDVVEVLPGRAARRSWSIDVELWTLEQGPSDLTLQLTVREGQAGRYVIELDGLHVL